MNYRLMGKKNKTKKKTTTLFCFIL